MMEKNTRITLRMLLTHTGMYISLDQIQISHALHEFQLLTFVEAGFGYSFLNKKLGNCSYNEFSGSALDLHQPLVNQPGELFEYGVWQHSDPLSFQALCPFLV